MKPVVSIVRCESYDFAVVKRAVKKCLEPFGGMLAFVKPSQNVLLKPNVLGAFAPEQAVTTHPSIVRAVVQLAKEASAKPKIAESSGIGLGASTTNALSAAGISQVAAEEGIDCFALETKGYSLVESAGKSFFASRAFLEANAVVSLPKLKTHALTQYTGAIKNSFAIVPTSERRRAHCKKSEKEFCLEMVDFFSVKKPALVVMDAVVAMEGTGPVSGKKKQLGFIIASNDAVALDAVVCNALGFQNINTLWAAREKSAGETDLEKIKIVGALPKIFLEKPEVVSAGFFGFAAGLFSGFLCFQPVLEKSACKKCRVCAKHCPVNAIVLKPFPEFDRKKCIGCFCCAELCPEQTIKSGLGIIGNSLLLSKAVALRFFSTASHFFPKKR